MFEKIVKLIEKYDKIIIYRHKNPDGDAIGSQTGLKHLILENYKNKEVYCPGDDPRRYAFMEDSAPDEVKDGLFADALVIILDLSAPELLTDTRYTLAAATARIDHHIFIAPIAEEEVINTDYESCCGLITEMAIESGWKMPYIAVKALYTGTVTDSGRFRYDSVNSGTFRRVSFLMESKIDTGSIFSNLYSDNLASVQLRASFTMKIKTYKDRLAYIYTAKDEFIATGESAFNISRGMVGTMSDLKGIDIWANFTETEEGILCELRSSKYNINPVAVKYGGGGHAKASGATLKTKEEAEAMLSDLAELLD